MRSLSAILLLSTASVVVSCGGGASLPRNAATNSNNSNTAANTNAQVSNTAGNAANASDGKAADLTMTALEIGTERQASGSGTDSKYKGKTITVTDGDMIDASQFDTNWVSVDAYIGKTRDEHVQIDCAVRSKLEVMPDLIKASKAINDEREKKDKGNKIPHPTVTLKGVYMESYQGVPGGAFTSIVLDPCEVVTYKLP